MKIEKHFMRISVIAFILALVPQISGAVLSSLYRAIVDFLLAEFLSYFNVVVRYVITPILFFAVFYFIGKKPDFELELRPNLLALLIGNIASFFIGSIVYSSTLMGTTVGLFLALVLQSLLVFFVANVLAALAGLSLGHIRRKKLTLSAEPELP